MKTEQPPAIKNLIEQARKGDTGALNELCAILREQVFYSVLGRFPNRSVCDELAQETMIWFVGRFDHSIRDENIPALLASKAFFLLKSHFREKYSRREQHASDEGTLHDIPDTTLIDELESSADIEEDWRKIEAAFPLLPVKYREVLEQRYLKNHTYPEIAGSLHISEANVRQRVKRGMDLLKKHVERMK